MKLQITFISSEMEWKSEFVAVCPHKASNITLLKWDVHSSGDSEGRRRQTFPQVRKFLEKPGLDLLGLNSEIAHHPDETQTSAPCKQKKKVEIWDGRQTLEGGIWAIVLTSSVFSLHFAKPTPCASCEQAAATEAAPTAAVAAAASGSFRHSDCGIAKSQEQNPRGFPPSR